MDLNVLRRMAVDFNANQRGLFQPGSNVLALTDSVIPFIDLAERLKGTAEGLRQEVTYREAIRTAQAAMINKLNETIKELRLLISRLESGEDVGVLVEHFRVTDTSAATIGDDRNWTPAQTAIYVMNTRRDDIAKLNDLLHQERDKNRALEEIRGNQGEAIRKLRAERDQYCAAAMNVSSGLAPRQEVSKANSCDQAAAPPCNALCGEPTSNNPVRTTGIKIPTNGEFAEIYVDGTNLSPVNVVHEQWPGKVRTIITIESDSPVSMGVLNEKEPRREVLCERISVLEGRVNEGIEAMNDAATQRDSFRERMTNAENTVNEIHQAVRNRVQKMTKVNGVAVKVPVGAGKSIRF